MRKIIIIDSDNTWEAVQDCGYSYNEVLEALHKACVEANKEHKEVVVTIETQ